MTTMMMTIMGLTPVMEPPAREQVTKTYHAPVPAAAASSEPSLFVRAERLPLFPLRHPQYLPPHPVLLLLLR
jgi:hypothetical protein